MNTPSWLLAAGLSLAVCGVLAPSNAHAETAHAKGDRVNLRSRPGFDGEILTQLSKGQAVQVLDEVTRENPAPGEPASWLKVALPEGVGVWVSAEYIDADSKIVTADVLNVRAGPSFDHAVVGRIPHGTRVETTGAIQEGWLQIRAPRDCHAFVPANWLTRGGPDAGSSPSKSAAGDASATATKVGAPGTPAASPPSTPSSSAWFEQFITTNIAARSDAPAPNSTALATQTASPQARVVTAPGPPDSTDDWFAQFQSPGPGSQTPPARQAPAGAAQERSDVSTKSTVPAPQSQQPPEALTKTPSARQAPDSAQTRSVMREGEVVRPFSIQSPSFWGLRSLESGRLINFLSSSRLENIDWRQYHHTVVLVSGQEYLDPRWPRTPILEVESIHAAR